jgi:hypothetical protein
MSAISLNIFETTNWSRKNYVFGLCPSSNVSKNTTFRKLHQFPSSGKITGARILLENCRPRRLMYVQPEGLGKVGRPRARWRDEVGKDARMLGLRSWWATAMNREEWRKLLRETKTF